MVIFRELLMETFVFSIRNENKGIEVKKAQKDKEI